MKKVFLLVIAMCLIVIPGCEITTADVSHDSDIDSSNTSQTALQREPQAEKETAELCFLNPYEGSGNENGFYSLKEVERETSGENSNKSSQYTNIMYKDYASKQEIVLCNKPNCKHDDDTCNGYIDGSASNNTIFVYHEKLYLFTNGSNIGASINIMNGDPGEDAYATDITGSLGFGKDSTPPTLYQYNLDGTNKTKIVELASGMSIGSSFITKGKFLYCNSSVTEYKKTDNAITGIPTQQKLLEIDLTAKTYKSIGPMKNKEILGTYQDKFLIGETIYPEGYDAIDTNDTNKMMEAINNAKYKIKSLNIDTQEETEHYTTTYSKINFSILYQNKVYFTANNSRKIQCLNLDTNQVSTVIEKLAKIPSITDVRDEKLVYSFWEDKDVNAEIETYYYVDLNTGENKEMTLFTKIPREAISILAETKDEYLVISGYDAKNEYLAHFNVWQVEVKETFYSLIKKSDYWNSKANFISIKNAK